MTSDVKINQQYAKDGFISDSSAQYLITNHSDQMLGAIWAFKSVPYFDAIEVGYQIFARQSRGKGYASQALSLLGQYIFDSKQVNRIELRIATQNIGSEKVAIKLGFSHEGTQREAAYSKGQLHDMKLYAMLRRDWPGNG
jgi:RimJ/RimL family protein N-acetyltransferase